MTAALGAAKGERTTARRGYRSGYCERGLVPHVGKLELREPQDSDGRFLTELVERYQRSEKAPVAAMAAMSVQGSTGLGPDRSTRKVKAIAEELCGYQHAGAAQRGNPPAHPGRAAQWDPNPRSAPHHGELLAADPGLGR
jgi:putative transposase